jgi:hypothetical protein
MLLGQTVEILKIIESERAEIGPENKKEEHRIVTSTCIYSFHHNTHG